MLYQPPFKPGATPAVPGIHNDDANASYVNGDPSTGTEGSYFPGEALEHGQREIMEVITRAGLTPSHEDLTQLWQALQMLYGSQRPRFVAVISATTSSPPGSPAAGAMYIIPSGASGAWSGKEHQFAEWTGAAWRYTTAPERTIAGVADTGLFLRKTSTVWSDIQILNYPTVQSAVQTAGITYDPASDSTVLSQALARYASGGIFGADSGSANSYVLTAIGNFVAPKAYFQGMRIGFLPANTSTGASVVTPFGLAQKKLLMPDGSAIAKPRVIRAGYFVSATYDTAADGGAGGFRLEPWVVQDTRVAAFSSADLGLTHGVLTTLSFAATADVVGTDIEVHGQGFRVNAVDRGVYLVALRVSREATPGVTKIVANIRLNGSLYESGRQEAASDQLMTARTVWSVPMASGDYVDFQALQENSSSASRTLKCAFVAYRMND